VNEIKPSSVVYKRALKAGAIITVPLLLLNVTTNRSNPLLLAIVLVVTIAVTLGFIWLYFRNTRYSADALQVTRKNLFGQVRLIPLSEIGTFVFPHAMTDPNGTANPTLVALRQDGTKLFGLSGSWWAPEDMTALLNATGKPADVIAEAITPAQLRERHPRAISWATAHPWAFACIIAGGVLAAGIIALVVAFAAFLS